MAGKFDEYLKTGGFTNQDREALQVKDAKDVERNSAPTPVANDPSKSRPDAPQPKLNEETAERIESTQQSKGNNYEQPTMAERYPAKEPDAQQAGKEQEKDQER